MDKLAAAEAASKEQRRRHEEFVKIVEGLEGEREKLRVECLRLNLLVEKLGAVLPVS